MRSSFSGRVTVPLKVHPSKANSPMTRTEGGITRSPESDSHQLKQWKGISVKPAERRREPSKPH